MNTINKIFTLSFIFIFVLLIREVAGGSLEGWKFRSLESHCHEKKHR